jgi:predicted secreted protein with PEFG-CTERM motif
MNIVQVDQVKLSSDGSFSTTINTANPMMKHDGVYQISATYGSVISHFDYITLVDGVELGSITDHVEEHHEKEVVDLANEVDYSISGGNVDGVTANVNGNSLVVSIHDAEDGGELTITLPSDVITPFNDGTFFVLVNDEESDDASQDGNTITVPFDADATTVEIIGTHVVPEFGTIAAIILAVAITSIIVISTRSKLNLVPKL